MWFTIIYLTDMGDSPTKNRQAGAVEVTPEMIEAGTVALWEKTTLAEFPHPADRLEVRIILEASLRARTID